MQFYKKITFIWIIFLIFQTNLSADIPYYLDFKYILNQSDAGKKAQTYLKNQLDNGVKSLKKKEKAIQEEERKIIQQKKVISAEEYKKKVTDLRNKVESLQKGRNSLLSEVSKQRSKARAELLKNLNPIIKQYMKEKNIRLLIVGKKLKFDREIEDYELTVCSAGLDNAFMVNEQYQKHIGKEVGVLLTNGRRKKGIILSYDDELLLEVEKKKKGSRKEYITEQVNISKEEIKETKLKINFK